MKLTIKNLTEEEGNAIASLLNELGSKASILIDDNVLAVREVDNCECEYHTVQFRSGEKELIKVVECKYCKKKIKKSIRKFQV